MRVVITSIVMSVLFLLTACSSLPEQPLADLSAVSKSVSSYNELGFAYLKRGNVERAKRAFIRALDFDRDSADALHGMALIYQREGESVLAERYFLEALEQEMVFPLARNNYAAFLYAQQRYAEACSQLEQTVTDTLYPNRALAFENLGLCYLQTNRQREAESAFLRALQLNGQATRSLLEISELLLVQNRLMEAQHYLQRHLEVAKASERGLMLAIRLAVMQGDEAAQRHYTAQLKQLHSRSQPQHP